MSEVRTDLFLTLSKTGMCLLTLSFFNVLLFLWLPVGQGLKKNDLVLFTKLDKISYDSE